MSKVQFKGSAMLNPVPVVLVTSKDKQNNVNAFTVGWIGTACTRPPIVSIAIRPERTSYKYICETKELVINLPNKSMVKKVDYCGVRSAKNTNKIKDCNFTLKSSNKINVPMIEECPISLECKVIDIVPLGTHHLFLCEILCSNVEENLIDKSGKICFEKADLICYSHGEYYPVSKNLLGTFGYSVRKKNKKNKKRKG